MFFYSYLKRETEPTITNIAYLKTYTKSISPSGSYPDTGNSEFTDGITSSASTFGYNIPTLNQELNLDIIIDLNGSYSITSFEYYNGLYGGGSTDYKTDVLTISTSTDGVIFTQQATTGTLGTQLSNTVILNISTVQATHVKFNIQKKNTGLKDWNFINEGIVKGY